MKKTIFSTALLTVLLLAGCASLPQAEEQIALPELTIGTAVDAPYFCMGEDGEYTGLDKDTAVEACRRMGYSPAFKVFTWGEQDALLADGTLDCVWECFAMNFEMKTELVHTHVVGSPLHLRQVIQNVLSYAVKFTAASTHPAVNWILTERHCSWNLSAQIPASV